MDETGVSGESASRERVVVPKRETRAYQRTTAFTKHVTVIHICRGNGVSLPPVFIVQGEGLVEDMQLDNVDSDAVITHQTSGYLTGELMVKVMEHIVKHTEDALEPGARAEDTVMDENGEQRARRREMLLIIDGAGQHTAALETTEYAFKHRIGILLLPVHTSHATQVSDLAVFRAFKQGWSSVQTQFHSDHPDQIISNANIISLLSPVWTTATRRENVIHGFKQAGIWPYNPGLVLDKLPSTSESLSSSLLHRHQHLHPHHLTSHRPYHPPTHGVFPQSSLLLDGAYPRPPSLIHHRRHYHHRHLRLHRQFARARSFHHHSPPSALCLRTRRALVSRSPSETR
jgi:hypothetical protein